MEFPDFGKHCFKCNQLDFLPFECYDCKKFFCLSHKSKKSHECPIKEEKPVYKSIKLKPIKKYECSTCKRKTILEIICNKCSNNFCTYHRHHEDHSRDNK